MAQPNVFYELSLRHAIGKPVVQMGGIPLPFDVHASRTIPFSFDVREAEKAREALGLQISEINSSGYQVSNLIKEAATLVEIARTGTPEMTALLRAVQEVAADVRVLTGDVQMLKHPSGAFVSVPTGAPAGGIMGPGAMGLTTWGPLPRVDRIYYTLQDYMQAQGVAPGETPLAPRVAADKPIQESGNAS